jgi:HEAT repeat protein
VVECFAYRRWIIALTVACTLTACAGKAPYEGKSAAQLERMLEDSKSAVQAQGAYGLSLLGPDAREAVPALIKCLKKESIVRQNAALALGKIGPDAREAVPALIEALRDPDWAVRRQAAIALGRMGPEARSALPILQTLARDSNVPLRDAAREALVKVQEKH